MLARRTVNPAVRTARARRDRTVSYVPGWAQAPDIGQAMLTMLRTVAGLRDRAPRPWTGSWTEPSVQPVHSGPSAARLRGIRAASAHDARSRTSHNPPVVGSSPTRPTCDLLEGSDRAVGISSGHHRDRPSGCLHQTYRQRTDQPVTGMCRRPDHHCVGADLLRDATQFGERVAPGVNEIDLDAQI